MDKDLIKKGDKVYSAYLGSSFVVKEVKGNALITEEGATLSSKMVIKLKNVDEVFKDLYSSQKEETIDKLANMSKIDNGETLYSLVQDNGMSLKTFLQVIKRVQS